MEINKLNILNSTPVLVLSTGYEPLFKTNWKKAISAVIGGRAEIVEVREDLSIRTGTGAISFPSVIRYLTGIFVGKIKKFCRNPRPTKRNLWSRDGGECQYCSKKVTIAKSTVDHVIPKSKGGKHEWKNIVLSCAPCNQKKGARLLENTSMKLKKEPIAPTGPDLSKSLLTGFI